MSTLMYESVLLDVSLVDSVSVFQSIAHGSSWLLSSKTLYLHLVLLFISSKVSTWYCEQWCISDFTS